MNLYRILFSHYAPRGGDTGMKALLLAENDEQVYEWIASEPFLKGSKLTNSWKDNEEYSWDEKEGTFVDKDGDVVSGWYDEDGKPELFKTRMLRMKGQINDEDVDFSDAYYGIKLLGWDLLKEDITTDYSELIELGIAFKAQA